MECNITTGITVPSWLLRKEEGSRGRARIVHEETGLWERAETEREKKLLGEKMYAEIQELQQGLLHKPQEQGSDGKPRYPGIEWSIDG